MTFQRMDDTFLGYGAKIDMKAEDDRADRATADKTLESRLHASSSRTPNA